MIRRIEIENFYSFLNETKLSFQVTNKAPNSKKYTQSIVEGERLTKVLGIIGPNASGKSNILRVFRFLKWFIVDSFGEKPESPMPINPFLLKEKPFDKPTNIKIEFEFEKKIYRYTISLSLTTIFLEELDLLDLEKNPDPERKRFKQLFSRSLNENTNEYEVKANPDYSLNEGTVELIKKRRNASLISAALFSNHEQSLPLKNYWSKVISKIKESNDKSIFMDENVWRSSEFFFKNQLFKSSMEEIISKFDLGLTGIEIQKVGMSKPNSLLSSLKQEFFMPFGRHKGLQGKEFKLPFFNESGGTQKIYVLLSYLLPILESGGLAVIDELEVDLHPDLLPVLLDLFISPETNPKGSQLIFTCHSTPLLNFMDKYQILIVEKDEEGVSQAWRLDEIEGVRNDDNFFAKYSAGAYGGIPHIGKLSGGSKN